MKHMKTIVALFEDLAHAQRGVEALQAEDVAPSRIGLLVRAPQSFMDLPGGMDHARGTQPTDVRPTRISMMPDGAARGGDDGAVPSALGVGSLLVGLAALSIPAIGPVLAMGPLSAAIATGGTGAMPPSVTAILEAAGVPEAEAMRYEAAVRAGRALVIATVGAAKMERVAHALARSGPLADAA